MYDLNAKTTFKVGARTKLIASLYGGRDLVPVRSRQGEEYESRTNLYWGNRNVSLKLFSSLRSNWFNRTNLYANDYNYVNNLTFDLSDNDTSDVDTNIEIFKFSAEDRSRIRDVGFASHNEVLTKYGKMVLGLHVGSVMTSPNQVLINQVFSNDTTVRENPSARSHINNLVVYSSHEYAWKRSKLVFGGRYSNYFADDVRHHIIEPRMAWMFEGVRWSSRMSYSRLTQPLHLLSVYGNGLPNNIWIASNRNLQPGISENFSIDVNVIDLFGNYPLSSSVYHRTLKNLIDYQEGVQFLFDVEENYLDKIELNGIGRVYGFELQVDKVRGKIKGWMSLSVGVSQRKFENINENTWFTTAYHKFAEFSTHLRHALPGDRLISGNLVWSTGYRVTQPSAFEIDINGVIRERYSRKNNLRLPNYFRVDLQYSKNTHSKNDNPINLSTGVYNATFHRNPSFIEIYYDFASIPHNKIYGNARSTSLFNFIPYISFSTKLGTK